MTTTLTDPILPTRNPDLGFWGTMACGGATVPGLGPGQAGSVSAWEIASRRIAEVTGAAPEWNWIFPDPAMTLAAVDRLVHHATILEVNVESYRRHTAVEGRKGSARPPTRAIAD
jgi:hypothetical protein